MTGKSVLVIDDNSDLRSLYVEALKMLECQVWAFASGPEALLFLRETSVLPEIVLVDMVMPGMDGPQFIREVRANERLRSIQIVVSSGLDGLAAKAREAGADGFLRKPVGLEQLERLCGGAQEARASF